MHSRYVFVGGVIIAMLLWLIVIVVIPVACVLWLPRFWGWAEGSTFRMVVGLVIIVFLALISLALLGLALDVGRAIFRLGAAREDERIRMARLHIRRTEDDALRRLEKTEMGGLLPLLRYSRAQLEIYYDISLQQTRRSFSNAVTAMWLGFMILILGVALYIGPVERLGLGRPSLDFNVLILSSAAIVEFISALFLWIYRSTISQLTFYYRLQMHSHSAILAFRMATSMGSADEAKCAIITSMLDSSMMPDRPSVEGARGLMSLIRPATAAGGSPLPASSSLP